MTQLAEFQQNEIQTTGATPDMNSMMAASGGVDIWGIVSRRKWLLIFGLILGSALGYIYLLNADPVYESTGRILVETKKPIMSMFNEFGGMDYRATGESKHALIITSPQLLFDAYNKGQLEKLDTFTRLDETERIRFLAEELSVEPADENGDIVDIRFRGPKSDDTQKVVDGVILAYKDFLQTTYKDESKDTREILLAQRNKLQKEKEALEKEYQEFQKNAPTFLHDASGESVSLPEKHQQDHDQKRIQLRHEVANINAEISAVKAAIATEGVSLEGILLSAGPNSQSSAAQAAESRRELIIGQRLLPLQLRHEELMSKYGPNHPEVRSIAKQLVRFNEVFPNIQSDRIERRSDDELQNLVNDYLASLSKQKLQLEAEVTALDQLFSEAEAAAKQLAVFKAEDRRLREARQMNNESFQAILKSITDIGMVANDNYQGYKYSLLGPPAMGEKVAPKPVKILPISAMLGMLAGFGIAYLVDLSDKAFRTPDEVSQVMKLPVVGHIPLIDVGKVKTIPGSEITPVIVTVHKPKSPQAEAYRAVRTALYFNTREKLHQVIQVTSPMPGDGKSTLATNLAVTIAQSGKSVLLMDADFRRPTLHKVLGLEKRDAGLAPFVGGEVELEDAVQSLPEIPNLSFLPCGTRPSNPSELLSSQDFANCLDLFRERYDFVIVDTPPVLAVSDGCIVSARVDGVILTFRIHKRAKPLATRARDALNNIGANVFGLVVNGVDQDAGGYYSQYRYGYSGYRYAYNYRYGYGYGQYGTYGSEADENKAINKYFDDDISTSHAESTLVDADGEELK